MTVKDLAAHALVENGAAATRTTATFLWWQDFQQRLYQIHLGQCKRLVWLTSFNAKNELNDPYIS